MTHALSKYLFHFFHYSQHPVHKIIKRWYIARFWAVCDINKPQGFWFAVEHPEDPDDYGWYQLCTINKEAGVMVRRVRYKYSVTLKLDARILLIENEDKLQEFVKTNGYHEKRDPTHPFSVLERKKLQNRKECQRKMEGLFGKGGYPGFNERDYMDDLKIDWLAIYRKYQGIIIEPYLWSFRSAWHWYNAWDCASGCVWDVSTIESFELVEKKQIRKIKGTQFYKMKEGK